MLANAIGKTFGGAPGVAGRPAAGNGWVTPDEMLESIGIKL